jgi:hypothetical protein
MSADSLRPCLKRENFSMFQRFSYEIELIPIFFLHNFYKITAYSIFRSPFLSIATAGAVKMTFCLDFV